jgi:beta-glucanase (GH16 family)
VTIIARRDVVGEKMGRLRVRTLSWVVLLLAGLPRILHAEPPEAQDWIPTLRAEFGDRLDTKVWAPASGSSNATESIRDPADIVLESGLLRLVTGHTDRTGWQWNSGQISSRTFRQTYGYFEARLRYAGATGLNNGVWLATDAPLAEGGVVIDIVQGHYPSEISTALRRDGVALAERTTIPATDLSRDFHRYGLMWLPNDHGSATLSWYFDGQLIRRIDCAACNQPAQLVIGTAVMSNAKVAGPATTALDGKSMDVAEIRAYELKGLAAVASADPAGLLPSDRAAVPADH